MRPLKLKVTGLRSHLGTTCITFPDDWQLASVVGPTGAGKSSLLEAIVYGLFGSGTVQNASQPMNLIADGAREMRVVLNFEVGDVSHQIVRTYRRTGAPPPPVLSSPGQTISGARPVEDAVTRVLGLSQDAFCQTALLPQGRFARLLEASASSQKNTLDEFFRLADVTEIAARIASASDQVVAIRDRVRDAREQLAEDPTADLIAAARVLKEAKSAAASAVEVLDAVTRLLANAVTAEQQASKHDRRTQELSAAAGSLEDNASRATELAELAADLTRAETEAISRRDLARSALDEALARLEELDARTVASVRAALRALTTRLKEANEAEATAARLRIEADDAQETYRCVAIELGELEASYLKLDQTAKEVNTAALRAADLARSGQSLAQRVAHSTERLADAQAAATEAEASAQAAAEGVEEAQRRLADAEKTLGISNKSAAATETDARLAAGNAEVASKHAEEVRRLVIAVQNAHTACQAANGALVTASEKARSAQAAAVNGASERESAKAVLVAAEADLTHARRSDAATLAAADCKPGDPCPVCVRDLPKGFVAPQSTHAVAAAESAVYVARGALDSLAAAVERAIQRAETAEADRVTAESEAAAAARALVDAERPFEEIGGEAAVREAIEAESATTEYARVTAKAAESAREDLIAATATITARSDALEPLRSAAKRAERVHTVEQESLKTAEQLANEASEAYAEFGGAEALARIDSEANQAAEAARAALEGANAAAKRLVDLRARHSDLRVAAGNTQTAADSAARHLEISRQAALRAAMEVPALARSTAADDPLQIASVAEAWASGREADLNAADRAVADARRECEEAGKSLDALERRRTIEHDAPLTELTAKAAATAALAGVTAPPTSDSTALAEWARSAAGKSNSQSAQEDGAAREARAEAKRSRNEAELRCQVVGVSTDELGAWRAEMDEAVGKAQAAFEQAESTAARCAELERALRETADRVALLQAGRTLSKGQRNFVLHVLAARRRQLLYESAAILTELSGGRLVFDTDATDRFSVIDTGSGAARDPRLLSGGEQFQASLALALGLVEIAARGGSQIECLFLDEGFGALDGRSLDIALDALETAARRGRRILAVTHVDAVTARCDHVLEVQPTPGGSRAIWRAAYQSAVTVASEQTLMIEARD